jgi:hypothetical protein
LAELSLFQYLNTGRHPAGRVHGGHRAPQKEKDLMDKKVVFTPPPLPATLAEWDAARDVKSSLTLNDRVETQHRYLSASDPNYPKYLWAVFDEQAVEGSLTDDDHEAARRIRELSETKEHADPVIAGEKIASIKKSLRIVLRRYHQGRKERKNMVGGQIVPDDDNSNE